jgi:hypothetical protein
VVGWVTHEPTPGVRQPPAHACGSGGCGGVQAAGLDCWACGMLLMHHMCGLGWRSWSGPLLSVTQDARDRVSCKGACGGCVAFESTEGVCMLGAPPHGSGVPWVAVVRQPADATMWHLQMVLQVLSSDTLTAENIQSFSLSLAGAPRAR